MKHVANAFYILIGWSLLTVGLPAYSQQNGAAAIAVGETRFYPSVKLSIEQNDNAYLTDTDVVKSTATVVSPKLDWIADRRLFALQASYAGDYSSSSESNLNYADHKLGFTTKASLSKRNSLNARLFFNQGHEAFGTGFTGGDDVTLRRQTIFKELGSTLRYTYGVLGARGNFILGLDLLDRSFDRQPDLTSGRDFFKIQTNAVFSLRVSPETRLLFETRFADFSYDDNRLDRQDVSLLIGARFNPTNKYGGAAKVGTTNNNFSDVTATDSSFGIVEVDLYYAPTSYSKFSFAVDRRFDSDNTGGFLSNGAQSIRETFSVNWQHDWSDRYSTVANIARINTSRECPIDSNANTSVGLSLQFKPRRWLVFGFGVTGLNRAKQLCDVSNDTELERVTSAFTVSATL